MAALTAASRSIVEVWWLDRRNLAGPADAAGWLTAAELSRREGFLREEDRERFTLGRFLARRVLARWCGCGPGEIRFSIGPRGRPLVEQASRAPWFSLTHSRSMVALAVAPWPEIGIDVEAEDSKPDLLAIAETIFGEEERAALANANRQERVRLFYSLWTLKEAYLKATGMGFHLDPRLCLFDPFKLPSARALGGGAGEDAGWQFHQWRVGSEYPLSLAMRPPPGILPHIEGPRQVLRLDL